MKRRGSRVWLAVAVACAASAIGVGAPVGQAQDDAAGDGNVLRIGWAQDPQTLNPFVALDEENFNVWSLNWDYLTGFDQATLKPGPGLATDWEVSKDQRTVTYQLDPDRNWSDGEPVTSEDVKFTYETLGKEGDIFAGYTNTITRIETPDPKTVVLHTKEPDARLIGGILVYILPEHIWGEYDLEEITRSFQPELPLVGSGPYIVTEFERGRIIRMERNPEWTGPEGGFDEIQYVKYGNQDGVERALGLGEIDVIVEVDASSFGRLAGQDDVEAVSSPSASYTQMGFNICPEELCPDAEFNPAIQDVTVRQAIAYAVDRSRINEIAAKGTSFVANGILPSSYAGFYEEPDNTYPFDPDLANQLLDDAGWVENSDGVREKDGMTLSFDLYARTESPYTVQAARLIQEMTAEVGIEMTPQIVSTDKLTELTVRKVDGKPAPEFDAFLWGWGGDAYDPSFLLSLLTTDEIGGLSDSFYSNPEYDALYEEQRTIFDEEERRAVIQEMVNLAQEDVAYLVLTEDPNLQAYRTDRIANVSRVCPDEEGDIMCEQVSYTPLLDWEPAAAGAGGGDDGARGGAFLALVGMALAAGIAYWSGLKRGRREAEPLELDE